MWRKHLQACDPGFKLEDRKPLLDESTIAVPDPTAPPLPDGDFTNLRRDQALKRKNIRQDICC